MCEVSGGSPWQQSTVNGLTPGLSWAVLDVVASAQAELHLCFPGLGCGRSAPEGGGGELSGSHRQG